MIAVYGLDQCSTCQKARAWLAEHGIVHRFIDYRAEPIPAKSLKAYARQIGWEKLVNRTSMTWRALPEARRSPQSDSDWLTLIAEYPALIRRPLLVQADGSVLSGFSAKRYGEAFAP